MATKILANISSLLSFLAAGLKSVCVVIKLILTWFEMHPSIKLDYNSCCWFFVSIKIQITLFFRSTFILNANKTKRHFVRVYVIVFVWMLSVWVSFFLIFIFLIKKQASKHSPHACVLVSTFQLKYMECSSNEHIVIAYTYTYTCINRLTSTYLHGGHLKFTFSDIGQCLHENFQAITNI